MEAASPSTRLHFTADLGTALDLASRNVRPKTRRAKNVTFGVWTRFCIEHQRHPSLRDVPDHDDKVAYLLVFALRYRQQRSVRADAVEKALLAVGQGISDLGEPDPRKLSHHSDRNHPLLAAFLKALRDEDSPSSRSYPANLTILQNLVHVLDLDHPTFGLLNRHTIDLIIVAFYWLLRPAEYLESTDPDARSQAFLFQDVTFTINGCQHPAPTAPLHDDEAIQAISLAFLTFSDQKNAVRGEQVGHRPNSDPFFCPVKALGRIARRLQLANAPADAPLFRHYNTQRGQWYSVKPRHVTNALRHSATALTSSTGIDPFLLSARSLRPGGATALLCAQVDSDAIRLLGRWKSDAMLRYLRIQAHTQSAHLSQRMLDHGSYTFAPGRFAAAQHPLETPPALAALLDHQELYVD